MLVPNVQRSILRSQYAQCSIVADMPAQRRSRCQSRALTSSLARQRRAKGGVACAVQPAASLDPISTATLAKAATAMFEATISTADTVLMALTGCRAVVGIVCGRSAVPVVDAA